MIQLGKICTRLGLALVAIAIQAISGCSTEVDLTAEEKPIWVVYGTLNPSDSVQYIRVARGFLIEGDAIEYAKNNDLSAKEMRVSLSGAGITLQAEQVDSILKAPEDGLFYPYTTLYKFTTAGATALEFGQTYELTIAEPNDGGVSLTSSTRIPEQPRFIIPRQLYRPAGNERCLEELLLETDYQLVFSPGSDAPGSSFEVRASLDYTENGVSKLATYGPSPMFLTNRGCSRSGGICYEISSKEVLIAFVNDIDPQPQNEYLYGVTDANNCNVDISQLPDAARLILTAMDANMTNFRRANDPGFLDVNSVRPVFTNIESEDDVITIGILGSYCEQQVSFRLSECSEYLLQLNGTPAPSDPCQF